MKTYNSSELNNKRSEILEEAAKNGVVIQEKKTNGEVRREFAVVPRDMLEALISDANELSKLVISLAR